MRKLLLAGLAAGAMAIAADATLAFDKLVVDRNAPKEFAALPDGVRNPEGITANPATGDVFVGTFDVAQGARNKLLRFANNGHLSAVRDFGEVLLLGLGFDAARGKVYVLNMGASKLQRIDASFDASTPIEDVAQFPSILAPGNREVENPDTSKDIIEFGSAGFPAPNAMTFDRSGNLYVSDSFQGAIYRIASVATCATPCPVEVVAHDPLLATAGFPPFGANGLALDAAGTTLYIANTGDSRVLKMDLATKVVSVFAQSLSGADGLVFDGAGRLWVCANQADEVVALGATGRVVARLGEFQGIRRDGAPAGLLFPASAVIVDDWMYVTNLALALTGGDEPEADVTRFTIARMKLPKR
jgi:DNA-binding beta-propeller fold protein YncE